MGVGGGREKCPGKIHTRSWVGGAHQNFQSAAGHPFKEGRADPSIDKVMQRILVGLPRPSKRSSKQLHFISKLNDKIALMERYTWKDDKGIFDTSSTHLRFLLNPTLEATHVGILIEVEEVLELDTISLLAMEGHMAIF